MRVSLHNIRKSFGPLEVVKGLNLNIDDGEFVVLLGPSGCGKTTALRMIAGLETVTGGTIRIGERDVTHMLPKYRDVAMVFQSYALYPHMSVAENIGYPLKLRKLARNDIISTAIRVSSPAANASALRLPGRWCARRASS
jgi:multiple sugar transport system ATP-binding protein